MNIFEFICKWVEFKYMNVEIIMACLTMLSLGKPITRRESNLWFVNKTYTFILKTCQKVKRISFLFLISQKNYISTL